MSLLTKNTNNNIIKPIMLYQTQVSPLLEMAQLSCTYGNLSKPLPNGPSAPNKPSGIRTVLSSQELPQELPSHQKVNKLGYIGYPYYGLYGFNYGYPWYPSCYRGYYGYYGYPWYF